MTNLSEESTFPPGIIQIETTDQVIGGPDGKANEQAKQLANRTAFLKAEVETRAPLADPAFTGTPTAPTPAPGTNTPQLATSEFVQAAIAALSATILNAPPATLDTLNELAAALGDDENFATTMTNALALKAPLASPNLTGSPTAPTQDPGTNDTTLANTAFVTAAIALAVAGLSMSAAEILALLLTVDGAGSNLDADFLDGLQHSQFVRSDTGTVVTGRPIFKASQTQDIASSVQAGGIEVNGDATAAATLAFQRNGVFGAVMGIDTDNKLKIGGWSMGAIAHTIWHQGLVTNLLAANGFVSLPNQMLIQWGRKTGGAADASITFPIAFNAVLSVVGSPNDGGNSAFSYDGLSVTGFTGHVDRLGDLTNLGSEWTWIAIGY